MAKPRGSLQIMFPDGTECAAWTSASVRESFLDALNSYEFTVEPPANQVPTYREKLKRGEKLSFNVNGNPLASPIIQTVDSRVDANSVTMSVACQSVLTTCYAGNVDPDLSRRWENDVTVDQLVLEVLALYGFDELEGDATAHVNALTGKSVSGRGSGVNVQALKLRDIQAQEGEAAYAFVSRIFKRLGAFLHVNHSGGLLLRAPDYDQAAAYTVVQDSTRTTSGDRALIPPGIQLHDSNQGLFSETVVRGHPPDDKQRKQTAPPLARVAAGGLTRPSGAPYDTAPTTSLDAGPGVYASTAAPYKPRFVHDKQARDADHCRNRARLIMGLSAANAYWLSCSVDGLVAQTGRVWTPDTVVRTVVEALDIDEELWVLERRMTADQSAERTHLRLLPKGALVLTA